MEKTKNPKKIIIVAIVVLIAIALITTLIIFLGKNEEEEKKGTENLGNISKTESEFEELVVNDIEVTYLEESNETKIVFSVENITDTKVEKVTLDIQFLDANDGIVAGIPIDVEAIDAKSKHKLDTYLGGNITAIEKIKLVNTKKQEEPAETEKTPAE